MLLKHKSILLIILFFLSRFADAADLWSGHPEPY